jgi:hypothetical protein
MIKITDSISKFFYKDSQDGCAILTYYNIHMEFTNQTLEDFLQTMINKFPVLKQYIIEKNSNIYPLTFLKIVIIIIYFMQIDEK